MPSDEGTDAAAPRPAGRSAGATTPGRRGRRPCRQVAARVGREVVVIGPALVWAAFALLPLFGAPQLGVPQALLVVVLVLVLLLRRRAPLGVAAATALLLPLGPGAEVAALVALASVAVRRSPRQTLLAGLLVLAGYTAALGPKASPAGWLAFVLQGGWLLIAIAALVLAATAAIGLYLGARRQLLVSAQERAVRAEADQAQRAQQARERERARIAREMHDVLAHRLSMLSLHAGALEYRADAVGGEVAEAAGIVRENAHQALQELRDVLGVLRAEPVSGPTATEDVAPDPGTGPEQSAGTGAPAGRPLAPAGREATGEGEGLRPQPSLAQVPDLVAEAATGAAAVELHLEGDLTVVPPAVGRAAYRIVQEGLTNARKHAPGTQVSTTVTIRPGVVSIEVRNTPPPVSGGLRKKPLPGSGTGLVGVAERAALLGGHVESGTTCEGGHALRVELPLPARGRTDPPRSAPAAR